MYVKWTCSISDQKFIGNGFYFFLGLVKLSLFGPIKFLFDKSFPFLSYLAELRLRSFEKPLIDLKVLINYVYE